jgi:N6-adenosine-specific RNA methylase IME4
MGDIAALAQDIAEIGLLHPIVIRPDGVLIAGERRLRACRELGWPEIPVTEVDIASLARGELAENTQRKDFLPSEAVAIAAAIEEEEKRLAKERMVAGKPLSNLDKGRATDKTAAKVGKARTSLSKAKAVVEAAKAEPDKFGKLLADMDRTGRVDGPYKRLAVARQADAIKAEVPPLPGKGPYRVIVVDPPWPYELRKADPSHRATHPYPQMSIAEICALDVPSIAHRDSILWLWTTNHHMREAFTVLDAWGFEHKTILTWGKDRFGYGDWLRGQTEHALMAVRGSPTVTLSAQSTLLLAPMRGHSVKPDEFYDLVESLCPAPRYAELFQRQFQTPRPNWDGHGDEATRAA